MIELLNGSPLTFCNDGILRIEGFLLDKVINYPLIDLQNLFKENELFLIQFFESPVSIENNTTLSNIILSLKPWYNLLTKFLDMDFVEYEKACFSLTTVKNKFDYLKVYKSISFVSPEFYNEKRGINLNQTYFGSLLGGFNNNDNKDYSIDEYDFQSLKNVPILIEERQKCKFTITGANVKNVFNKKLKGIVNEDDNSHFYVSSHFTFSELLKSIFIDGLYYKTPVTFEQESMSSIINEEIRLTLEEFNLDESKPIFSIVGEDGEEAEKEENKEYEFTIEFDDNLDDISYDEMEVELWNYIFNSLKSSSNLKIGNIIVEDQNE